jgi:glyoxylase-like metal-dependent hydrolase (beta-lactamase superfamily II)
MLDGGSSRAHTKEFLRALAAEGAARLFAVVCTHSHCDSVTKGRQLASELG